MKKIILFVLMIIASVNLFSEDLPDDLYYCSKKAYTFYRLVLEDTKHNNNIELNGEYYLGTFDDDTFGHFIYKVKANKNIGGKILYIFNEGDFYHFTRFEEETSSGHLLTLCNIRIFEEGILLYEVNLHLEDDNVIHECYFDYTTFTHYDAI